MNRLLIITGLVLIAGGVLWRWLRRLPLFHLPGDILIARPGFRFMLPITSLILLSAVISLLMWLLRR